MAKLITYATATALNEGMYFYTAMDTDADATYESRKVTLAAIRSRLLQSQQSDGGTAFAWDTANAFTSGKLQSFKNNGTEKSYIDYNGFLSNTIGTREYPVPLGDMFPATTNGCAAAATVEHTAGQVETRGFAFDGATNEYLLASVVLPKSYDGGTITAQIHWTSSATDTDTVIWGVQGVALNDDDAVDAAFGSAQEVTDTLLGAAYDKHRTAKTSAITIAGTPGDADEIVLRIYRDAATDTATEDAILTKLVLFYTIDTPIDS